MKSKILIVEDESILAMSFQQYLNSFGLNVVGVAATGEEAIRKAAEFKPDLVLMDIILKGEMDGIEAATIILQDYDIPVVYLTAHPEENILNRAKKTSPYGYITKPINKTDLKNTVDLALYKHTMELKLKESEVKYRTLFESDPDYNILIDTDGKIQDVNNTITQALGCSKNDLIGLNFWNLEILKSEKQLFKEKMQQILKGKSIEPFEYQFIGKKGDAKWIIIQLTPIITKGEISSVLCIANDVTEIKKAEEKIRKSENDLIKAQKLGNIGSFHYDFNKNIEIWSLNLYRMLKIDPEVNMGFDELFKYIIPEDHSIVINKREKLFKERNPISLEFRMIDNGGEFKYVQCNIEMTVDENNRPLNVIGTIQDITERKKAEKHIAEMLKKEQQLTEELKISNEELQVTTEELQATNEELQATNEELQTTTEELQTANEELQAATDDKTSHEELVDSQIRLNDVINQLQISNKELEQFVQVVSHDLQDPLEMVSSYTQMLELRYKGKLDEDADEYINSIARGTQKMKEIIDEFTEKKK